MKKFIGKVNFQKDIHPNFKEVWVNVNLSDSSWSIRLIFDAIPTDNSELSVIGQFLSPHAPVILNKWIDFSRGPVELGQLILLEEQALK